MLLLQATGMPRVQGLEKTFQVHFELVVDAHLDGWVEKNISETLTFYQFPRAHTKHLKSANMIERFNEEIGRRTYVVRIFPNQASALRLIRALGAEINERWIEEHRYLNMAFLKDREREFAFTVA